MLTWMCTMVMGHSIRSQRSYMCILPAQRNLTGIIAGTAHHTPTSSRSNVVRRTTLTRTGGYSTRWFTIQASSVDLGHISSWCEAPQVRDLCQWLLPVKTRIIISVLLTTKQYQSIMSLYVLRWNLNQSCKKPWQQ